MIESHTTNFDWVLCCFGPLFRALVACHVERDRMSLPDVVGVTIKMAQLLISRCLVNWQIGVCWMIVHTKSDLTGLPLLDGEHMIIIITLYDLIYTPIRKISMVQCWL